MRLKKPGFFSTTAGSDMIAVRVYRVLHAHTTAAARGWKVYAPERSNEEFFFEKTRFFSFAFFFC